MFSTQSIFVNTNMNKTIVELILTCKIPKFNLLGVPACTTTLVMTSTNTEHAEQQSRHFHNLRPQNEDTR
jgi:hypothetical protein